MSHGQQQGWLVGDEVDRARLGGSLLPRGLEINSRARGIDIISRSCACGCLCGVCARRREEKACNAREIRHPQRVSILVERRTRAHVLPPPREAVRLVGRASRVIRRLRSSIPLSIPFGLRIRATPVDDRTIARAGGERALDTW